MDAGLPKLLDSHREECIGPCGVSRFDPVPEISEHDGFTFAEPSRLTTLRMNSARGNWRGIKVFLSALNAVAHQSRDA